MTLKELEVLATLDGTEIRKTDRCNWPEAGKCKNPPGNILVYEMFGRYVVHIHRPCNEHFSCYLGVEGRHWKALEKD